MTELRARDVAVGSGVSEVKLKCGLCGRVVGTIAGTVIEDGEVQSPCKSCRGWAVFVVRRGVVTWIRTEKPAQQTR